ncbi:MAG TPA: RHS repeat-associated core domain-containing protein, partial [Thermoanaerobaculia bacterium]
HPPRHHPQHGGLHDGGWREVANGPAHVLSTGAFQALPFVEPTTGLIYARARWYDPSTGSFLSPDPKGYIDSSNLYAFAGGDPVNRRDPTGEDAYDDRYQAYVRWYGAQADTLWQRRKAIAEEIRRRRGRDIGDLQAEDNILATRMLSLGGISESAGLYFEAARAAGDQSVLCKSFEQIHAEIVSDEAVKFVGAAVVCGFMPHAPAAQQRLKQGGSRAVRAYNNSILSSETGAVGPHVTNTAKAKRGPKPKGEGPHNLTIEARIAQLKAELGPEWEHVAGGMLKEQVILTPGGVKSARRPDITFRNRVTGEVYHENIGKTYASGAPIKREIDALNDLEGATGKRPGFTPYDR